MQAGEHGRWEQIAEIQLDKSIEKVERQSTDIQPAQQISHCFVERLSNCEHCSGKGLQNISSTALRANSSAFNRFGVVWEFHWGRKAHAGASANCSICEYAYATASKSQTGVSDECPRLGSTANAVSPHLWTIIRAVLNSLCRLYPKACHVGVKRLSLYC